MVDVCMAWGRSLVAYVFLCAYIALVGPPALVWTFLTGRAAHIFALGIFGAKMGRILLGVRLQAEGLERILGDTPTVYFINHRSHVDVAVFEVLLPRCPKLRAIYKAEMDRLPILAPAMRAAGFVPVHRGDRQRALEAVDAAIARLAEGYSFLLAPEGTRGTSDTMLPLKKGGLVMAIKAQAPVVPIALIGTGALMPRGQLYVKPGTMIVRIGREVPTRGLTLADRDALSERVRDQFTALLAGPDGQRVP
jgi:1-acyl-sn-glycerol-3-phosphate acyltransferase